MPSAATARSASQPSSRAAELGKIPTSVPVGPLVKRAVQPPAGTTTKRSRLGLGAIHPTSSRIEAPTPVAACRLRDFTNHSVTDLTSQRKKPTDSVASPKEGSGSLTEQSPPWH